VHDKPETAVSSLALQRKRQIALGSHDNGNWLPNRRPFVHVQIRVGQSFIVAKLVRDLSDGRERRMCEMNE
jgi:hypothetical protein